VKLSRGGFYGVFVLLLLLAIIVGGCDLFNTSLVDYFRDHHEIVEATGVVVRTIHNLKEDGTILIPPGSARIGVILANPRNLTFKQELVGAPAGKNIAALRAGPAEIEVHIDGAEEEDEYALTLALQSPDGLRDFPSYPLRIRCVSFETVLQDFTVNGATPSAFDPAQEALVVKVPYSSATVTLAWTTAHPGALIELYVGKDDSGELLAKQAHSLEATRDLAVGDNHFYLRITAPSSTWQGYAVTIQRASTSEKAITAFSILTPTSATGSISGNNITVNVPYGTTVSNMTALATHTGASISPDPASPRSYANPVAYTVTAEDGTTATYTVTVSVALNPAKAITAFSILTPTSVTGSISGNNITVTVPYGTSVTAMTASATHTGASISPDPGAARSYANPVDYTVTAEDGTTATYTVTVVVEAQQGITISGITVEGLNVLNFSLLQTTVTSGEPIIITISGGSVTSWHIDINGPVSSTASTANTVTFAAPTAQGFYNVNVIARAGGIDYSGSFGLTVD
jgi:hypothetical protein